MKSLFVCLLVCLLVEPSSADKKIGEFELNGVTLKIPREYLWLGKNKPDGEIKEGDTLHVMATYPEMNAGSANGEQGYNTNITLHKNGLSRAFADDSRVPLYLGIYASFSGITSHNKDGKSYYNAEPIYIGTYKQIGNLSYYKLPHKNNASSLREDWFIRGNVLKPDLWIRCQKLMCKSYYSLSDEILVSYGFKRILLDSNKHDELRKKITDLLNGFVQ